MFCQNCGSQLSDSAKFCPNCGSRIERTPKPTATETQSAATQTVFKGETTKGDYFYIGNIPATREVCEMIDALLNQGNKIEAIRMVRSVTGLGLAEAKDFVDTHEVYNWTRVDPNLIPQAAPIQQVQTQQASSTPSAARTAVPDAGQRARPTGGIVCARCGSNNVNVQVIQENQGGTTITKTKSISKEKKHGILWWLFIGWWWWMIDIFFWIFLFPLRLFVGILNRVFKKKKYVTKSTSIGNTSNRIIYKKICTCQNCGNSWRINS